MANSTWKISRSRGAAQLPIGILIVLAIIVVLLGKAQSQIFDRARAGLADWMAPVLTVVRSPVQGVENWIGSIGEIFTVYKQNLKLKEENARLRQWHNAAIVLQERLHRYQLLLHAIPDPELSSVLAQVIGRTSRPFQQTMILDAGSVNGVKPGQAVVDPRGMIGRIYIAGRHTSWVIQLTDLNSHVPVTIEPGNIQAIMAGDNTSEPTIEVVSQNANLKDGDQVASSGDGSLLPPGLPIGTLHASGSGFRVSLLADPAASQDVNILDYKRPIENPPAPRPNDLPAVAAGLKPAAPAPAPAPQILVPTLQPNPALKPQTAATPAPGATQLAQHATPVAQTAHPKPSSPSDNASPDDDQTNQ
jgi:rod shape-determining protein MreC